MEDYIKVEKAIVNGFKVQPVANGSLFTFDVVMPDGSVTKGTKSIVSSPKKKGQQPSWNIQNQQKIIYVYLYDRYIK